MKKRISTKFVLTFVAGTVFGVSMFVLLSFTSGTSSPSPYPLGSAIPFDTAKAYVRNFRHDYPNNLKGIAIDKDQFDAMLKLVSTGKTFGGFRVYNGKNNTQGLVSVVVGMTPIGKDDTTAGQIYLTTIRYAGPCPTSCDYGGPLN